MGASAPTVLEPDFWEYLDCLVAGSRLVIDRPKGSCHPGYPNVLYPVDYGYLEGTTTTDRGGLDVWAGTLPEKNLTALVITADLMKKDVEIKLLLGCTSFEQQAILDFHNNGLMRAVKIIR
jgi:inorganic pyrophosphatase